MTELNFAQAKQQTDCHVPNTRSGPKTPNRKDEKAKKWGLAPAGAVPFAPWVSQGTWEAPKLGPKPSKSFFYAKFSPFQIQRKGPPLPGKTYPTTSSIRISPPQKPQNWKAAVDKDPVQQGAPVGSSGGKDWGPIVPKAGNFQTKLEG